MSEQDESSKEMDFGEQLTTEVEAVAMMIKLVGMIDPYADRIFPIDKPEFFIGRSKTCDLVLEENTISGKHARIFKVEDHYEVEDLDSTNGILVNDQRVKRQALRSEDIITFDEVPFQYVNPREVSRTVVSPRKDLLDIETVERKRPAAAAPRAQVPESPAQATPQHSMKDEAKLPKTKPFPDPIEEPKPDPEPLFQDTSDASSLTSAPTAPLPVVVPDREDSGPHPGAPISKPTPPTPTPTPRTDPAPYPPVHSHAPPAPVSPSRPEPSPAATPRPSPPPPPQRSAKTSPDLIINPYQPQARYVHRPEVEGAGAMSSLFTGLTFAVLFSFFGTFLGIWGQIKFSGDPMAVLKSMAIMFPLWHTHLPWLTATWNAATVITAICLPAGPILGGLLTQSMWRERPAGTAAVFSVIYALGFIALQIIALDFQLDNAMNLPQINSIGLGNPALAILSVYGIFLIVTFLLSLLGTLAGKK